MSQTETLPPAGGSYTRDPVTGELKRRSGTEAPADRADPEPDPLGTARPADTDVDADASADRHPQE